MVYPEIFAVIVNLTYFSGTAISLTLSSVNKVVFLLQTRLRLRPSGLVIQSSAALPESNENFSSLMRIHDLNYKDARRNEIRTLSGVNHTYILMLSDFAV